MREQKRTNFIIPIAVILIALVFGMMMIEPDFFELGERRYKVVDDNSHIIELGRFSLLTPNNFKYVEQEGIDSFVGLITDGTDSIEFDFGWYSNDLTSEDYNLSNERINGRQAVTGFSNTYGTAVHFPNLRDNNSLTVYSETLTEEEALNIFRTIKIANTDTTRWISPIQQSNSDDFNKFLERWNTDSSFQLSRIRFPHEQTIIDGHDGGEAVLYFDKPSDWIHTNLEYKSKYSNGVGLDFRQDTIRNDRVIQIKQSGEDSSTKLTWNLVYEFSLIDAQWYLTSSKDLSY
ncbi:MAG: hypothetical protein ABJG41_01160 [Cyclobacteriaceae bacterium]